MREEPRWVWLVIAFIAVTFWTAFSYVTDAPEPWDTSSYPVALAVMLLLVAGCGYALPYRAWRWGVIATLAQQPVMLIRTEFGPLWAIGLILLAIECIPAVIVAITAAWLRRPE